jgi:hypothetical protein
MVAAAIIGGAVVGAAGTAVAGHEAANATEKGSKAALKETHDARIASEGMSLPYRQLGEKAISSYEDLLGLGSKGAAGIQETLSNLPGYQFAKSQGIEGTSRALAAQGMNLSGNQATALADYTTGLADQTYGEQLNRLLQPINIGQAAAAGQAANNTSSASSASNILTNQGNTIAGIRAGTAAGINNAVVGGVNSYLENQTLQGLMTPGAGAPPTYPGAGGPGVNYPPVMTGSFSGPR